MRLSYHSKSFVKPIQVPGSKSITNRLLVLRHLFFPNMHLGNASSSTDSLNLQKCLDAFSNDVDSFHVEDGGTTLRFLLCFLAVQNKPAQITCGNVLLQRPHNDLIDTLNEIGFNISKNSRGFVIHPVDMTAINTSWKVNVSRSSQFATALILVAPYLNSTINIQLVGDAVSKGYMELTIQLMQDLGFEIHSSDDAVSIQPFSKKEDTLVATVESDWSSISYFVAIARLSNQSLNLSNVDQDSFQPDIDILNFALKVGLQPTFEAGNLILDPIPDFELPKVLERDYTNCPDIALTEIVLCHALGIQLNTNGIAHLKYKESNRFDVIQQELVNFESPTPNFATHKDHRIAMCLTCLSILKPIQLDDISVVSKSFPDFWQEVSKVGIYLTPNNG